jgi:tetratricopeptide (TPR) repeat protein
LQATIYPITLAAEESVKNRNWLSIAEYVLLIGSGVGSLATLVAPQVLLATGPMSALLLVNLIARHRLAKTASENSENSVAAVSHLDQKWSDEIVALQQQIHGLPSFLDLASLRKAVLHQNQDSLALLSQEIEQLKQELSQTEWREMRQNVQHLQKQYTSLSEAIAKITSYINRLSTASRVESLEETVGKLASELAQLRENVAAIADGQKSLNGRGLQDQIDRLNRRLNNLPAPFDASSVKQDVDSLLKVVSELASRRDLARLEAQLEKLNGQNSFLEQSLTPLKVATSILRKQLDALTTKLFSTEQFSEKVFKAALQQSTPQVLDSAALQDQMKSLTSRIDWVETNAMDVRSQVDAAVKTHFERVLQTLPGHGAPLEYELVFDVQAAPQQVVQEKQSSHAILQQVLEQAQSRLIVVYPYPDPALLDETLVQSLRGFLERKGCLDLGWGHLGDVSQSRFSHSIDRRRGVNALTRGFLYDVLNQLTELKKQYPDQFRFKVLGTSEHFLVCDRSFAILGTPSMATASVVFPKAMVGLRTTNAQVIQGLVERFDNPLLEAGDVTAYFNRATTRYELGDLQGAIADYTEVLHIHPDDVAFNNRGLAHYDLNERERAIADFNQAIQYNPENYVAYFNRGFIRSELSDRMGAIQDYSLAIQINSDYTPAYFYRGLARTRMQNKLGAIEDYTEVIRLNPTDANAYFYRGLAAAKIGQRSEAINDLRQAAHFFKQQGDRANYQQTIQTLNKLHRVLDNSETDIKPLVSNGISQ